MRSLCTRALVLALTSLPVSAQGPDASSSLPPDQDPKVFIKKGVALELAGDFDGAVDSFNKALQLDPQNAAAYENRGEARTKQGELTDAISDFGKALQIQPEYDVAFLHRGLAEVTQGDLDAAIGDFNHTLELQPSSGEAFLERGRARYLKGDADGAIADTSEALSLNSKLGKAHFFRGLAYDDKGSAEKAADDFQEAATSGVPEAALWFWSAKKEDHEDANPDDFLVKALAGHPNPWLTELADFIQEKTTDTQLLADALKGKPEENRPAQAWFFVGLSREFSGDTNGAQQAFQQTLTAADKTSPLTVEARRQLKNIPSP
jgi:tetratricopeptide (TPR) repeat protein